MFTDIIEPLISVQVEIPAVMKLNIHKVEDKKQISIIAALAEEIWQEAFTPIIGSAQVEYMLEKFQSVNSISRQISNEDYQYFQLNQATLPIGYFSFKIHDNELFLSKFYILSKYRNQGFGKQTINFIEQQAVKANAGQISLTVNKYNTNAIKAYLKMGFINKGAIIKNIGGGFIMDDYRMVKELGYTQSQNPEKNH